MAIVDRSKVARCVSKDQRSRCYSCERAVSVLAHAAGYVDLLLLMSRIPFLASEAARYMPRSRW